MNDNRKPGHVDIRVSTTLLGSDTGKSVEEMARLIGAIAWRDWQPTWADTHAWQDAQPHA